MSLSARRLICLGVVFLSACSATPGNRQLLDEGEESFANSNYNRALSDADTVIATGDGPALAEAYYLKGRVLEDRLKNNPAAVASDLAAARAAYATALSEHPSLQLEALIHGQFGNVAYFQQDYPAALQQWTEAYSEFTDPQAKQWILYRMGLCQQRLGLFMDADRTFQKVQQDYPGSEPAIRARSHEGVRAFYVQVGAYTNEADITRAAAAITAAGFVPLKTPDHGLTIVRTPDVPSYAQAEQMRQRLLGQYPDATVMP